MIRPVPAVLERPAYRVPKHPAPVDLRLDGNEGLPGPPLVRSYPKVATLEAALAERLDVAPEAVLVTAGADDALDRACRVLLAPGRDLVLPSPSFEMLDRYARLAGADVHRVPWPDGPWPVDDVIAAGRDAAAIALVSPNNPTGGVVTADDLRRVATACPDVALLVDHAYVEFADDGLDLSAACRELPQALVFRTLSKAWGMAGLRVGYVTGDPEVVGWLRRVGLPYAVSGPSVSISLERLAEGQGAVDAFVERVRAGREALTWLIGDLPACGVEALPSQGNFVFLRGPRATALWDGLAHRGIAIRAWPGDSVLGDCVRITIPGVPEDDARLLAAVRAVLTETTQEAL